MNCVKCIKKVKCIGGTVLQSKEGNPSLINLYCCFNPQCPNFCLTQVGLKEVEE